MKQSITKVKKVLNSSRIVVLCWAVSVTVCASICMFTSAAAAPQTDWVVRADGASISVTCSGEDVEDALSAAGVNMLQGDSYTTVQKGNIRYVDVLRAKVVTLTVNGQTEYVRTGCSTVGELLKERNIVLDADDTLSANLQDKVTDGMAITVAMTDVQTVTMQVDLVFETEYRDDPNAYDGETTVLQSGKNGRKQVTYTIVSENGVVTSLQVGEEEIVCEPVNQIVARGTKQHPTEESTGSDIQTSGSDPVEQWPVAEEPEEEPPADVSSGNSSDGSSDSSASDNTVQAWDGTIYTYSEVLNMTATAYTFNSGANITASGVPAQVGVIAADLSYLPMGTVVYIVSASGSWEYGYAVVGDTGVSGAKVDLFFNTYDECIQFGIQDALVYVIG